MKPDPSDVVVGAAAGGVATVPMTLVMEELHDVLPGLRAASRHPDQRDG